MSRDLDSDSLTHINGELVRPFLALHLDYPEGPVRATTLPFNVTLAGETFYGVGTFGGLSEVQEGSETVSYMVQASLSGIPTELLQAMLAQKIQGRLAQVALGFVNADWQIIGEPTILFVGRMDTQDFEVGSTTTILVSMESLMVDWDRANVRRFTDVDQKSEYPDDRGLEYVAAVANKEIVWGRA